MKSTKSPFIKPVLLCLLGGPALADPCTITITNPPTAEVAVSSITSSMVLQGTAASVTGTLSWVNQANAASGTIPASGSWSVFSLPLDFGTNVIVISGGESSAASVTTNALDSGSDPAYATSWDDPSNGGFGFGPWTLFTTAGSPANGGHFMAEGQVNLSVGPRAWGIYANSEETTWAERPLSDPLEVGQSVSFRFDNNGIQANGITAVHLSNSDSEHLWFFEFQGGDTFYTFHDQVTDFGFTDQGIDVIFHLTSPTNYTVTLIDHEDGQHTYTGALEPRANGVIDRLRFWNINAGPDESNNFYFNDPSVTTSNTLGETCSATVTVVRAGTPPPPTSGNLPLNQPYIEAGGYVAGEAEFYHGRETAGGVTWTDLPANAPDAFANPGDPGI